MRQRFPNNGFVDSWGQLTDLGRAAVDEFRSAYPEPIAFLKAKFRKLANAVLEQIAGGLYTMDEFKAEVFTAASDHVRRYDADKGAAVKTYLAWNIRQVANQMVRQNRRDRPLHYEGFFTDQDGTAFIDTCPANERVVNTDAAEQVELALRVLDQRSRYIIRERVAFGRTCREIGETLGITDKRVQQIERDAMAKLRSGRRPRGKTHDPAVYQRMKARRESVNCLACKRTKATRPRFLCCWCYNRPEIRERFPVTSTPGKASVPSVDYAVA